MTEASISVPRRQDTRQQERAGAGAGAGGCRQRRRDLGAGMALLLRQVRHAVRQLLCRVAQSLHPSQTQRRRRLHDRLTLLVRLVRGMRARRRLARAPFTRLGVEQVHDAGAVLLLLRQPGLLRGQQGYAPRPRHVGLTHVGVSVLHLRHCLRLPPTLLPLPLSLPHGPRFATCLQGRRQACFCVHTPPIRPCPNRAANEGRRGLQSGERGHIESTGGISFCMWRGRRGLLAKTRQGFLAHAIGVAAREGLSGQGGGGERRW